MGKIWRMSNDTKNTLYDKQKNQKMSVTYVSTLIHQTIRLFMYVCTKWKKKKKKIEIVFYGRNRVFRDPAKNMRITVSSRNLLWHDKTHRITHMCRSLYSLFFFSRTLFLARNMIPSRQWQILHAISPQITLV